MSPLIKRIITLACWHNFEQAHGVMVVVCIECWLDLRCLVQRTLLCVPKSSTFLELFSKEVASKLIS